MLRINLYMVLKCGENVRIYMARNRLCVQEIIVKLLRYCYASSFILYINKMREKALSEISDLGGLPFLLAH